MSRITIEHSTVTAVSPEGLKASMPVTTFLDAVAPRKLDTGGIVLPDGVKAVISEGPITIMVWECPPSVQRLKWLAADSPKPYGPGSTYRYVKVALPYNIILAVFAGTTVDQLQISDMSECFFRTEPLKTLDDQLFYPGLLNCSRYKNHPVAGAPLSWICTQYMRRTAAMTKGDLSKRLTASFDGIRGCLMDSGFNLSSEYHEGGSWFGYSSKRDERIETIERWEKETEKRPLFVLDVPWIPVGLSVRQVCERTIKNAEHKISTINSADMLSKYVFNQKVTA